MQEVDSAVVIEKLKYQHNLRLLLIEKGLLAAGLAILGFFISMALARYDSNLKERFDAQQLASNLQLQQAHKDGDTAVEHIKAEFQKEIEAVRQQHDKDLEVMRNAGRFQGAFAERRLRAYEDIWKAMGSWGLFLSTYESSDGKSDFRTRLGAEQRAFNETLMANAIFLDPASWKELQTLHLDEKALSVDGKNIGTVPIDQILQELSDFGIHFRYRAFTELQPGVKNSGIPLPKLPSKNE